jgi:hypothetical protein
MKAVTTGLGIQRGEKTLLLRGNAADLFSKQPNPPKWAETLITRYSLDRVQDLIVHTDC